MDALMDADNHIKAVPALIKQQGKITLSTFITLAQTQFIVQFKMITV